VGDEMSLRVEQTIDSLEPGIGIQLTITRESKSVLYYKVVLVYTKEFTYIDEAQTTLPPSRTWTYLEFHVLLQTVVRRIIFDQWFQKDTSMKHYIDICNKLRRDSTSIEQEQVDDLQERVKQIMKMVARTEIQIQKRTRLLIS
jgi:hypothetical protein